MESSSTPQKPAGTRYVILMRAEGNETGDYWERAGIVTASSDAQAVRQFAASDNFAPPGNKPFTLAAIPARSFKEHRIHVETQRVVKLG